MGLMTEISTLIEEAEELAPPSPCVRIRWEESCLCTREQPSPIPNLLAT